jgi:hypothetical protein
MDTEADMLRERVRELESRLGIQRESDGQEILVGVTTERVEELRILADAANEASGPGDALRDAVLFYDLVRKAWKGTREDYDELQTRVDLAITWLVTVTPDQPASIIADRAKLALKALRPTVE